MPETTPDIGNRVTRIETEIEGANRAVEVAFAEINRRLLEMNEFRAQISNERSTFITNKEALAHHESLRFRIESLDLWKSNIEGRLWMLGVVLLSLNTIIAIGVSVIFHLWK